MRTNIFDDSTPRSFDEYFDSVEKEPEKNKPSQDFSSIYFKRIQRFPVLTKDEERDLLERWCKFKDERAKDRIARAHLRMVPPIARRAAQKFGFEPFWPLLPSAAKQDAFNGYQEVVSDLTAEGNCALANALEHYDLSSAAAFNTYARTCIRNAIIRRAKELRSVVDRPFYRSAAYDLSINPTKPDPHDFRDYVGSRANPTVSDDPEDDSADGRQPAHTRLRPLPKEPQIVFEDSPRRYSRKLNGPWRMGLMGLESARIGESGLSSEETTVVEARVRGFTLKEVASDLGMSVSTAWRTEKRAIEKLARLDA